MVEYLTWAKLAIIPIEALDKNMKSGIFGKRLSWSSCYEELVKVFISHLVRFYTHFISRSGPGIPANLSDSVS